VRARGQGSDAARAERDDDVEGGVDAASAREFDAVGLALRVVLHTVQGLALVVVLVARHFGIVANSPLWAYAGTILGSSLLARHVDKWTDIPRGSWRLHARVGFHAATVAAVIYLTGWGPALGVCFVYAALIDLQQCGAASWRAVLGWSVAACTAGQLLVLEGWVPSFLSRSASQALGFLGAFAFGIAIRMAGAIGEGKDKAEELLAWARDDAQRSEAHHRAVVENAAEGIYTVGIDGRVGSFNAAAEAMFGWTAEEIVGESIVRIVPPELHDALTVFIATFATEGQHAVQRSGVEIAGVRRDGTQFPMMVSTNAITIEGSDPIISCIVRDLSEQKHFEARLAHQALHDPLTGLPNRVMLTDRLDQALARVRRHSRMCGVLFVDLDRFKSVNDTLGHTVGDQLLIEAATRIQAAVRETDTVARLGGDEFVVVCEDIEGVHHATDLAQRIINALQIPFSFGDDDTHVSASIGLALSADGNVSADAILANADMAMYRAKENGRSRYELFDEAMQQWVTTQVALETALRQAVARSELHLVYQPIIATETGRIRGFEALVRWERPGVGLVPPDDFIPTAEETGLIVEIGAWVLEEACRQAASWGRQWPDRRLGIAVNVSGRQLLGGDFLDVVAGALSRTGLDPTMLTLELTESTLIDDAVTVQALLRELRGLGINLSLDDFGTGYSSLTYLRAFPINIVKIDKSFVRTIGTERQDTAIVAAVLALAKNLDLSVVAEGVENEEQLAVLLHLQCPFVQGYLFSRPMPIGAIAQIVDAPEQARLWDRSILGR